MKRIGLLLMLLLLTPLAAFAQVETGVAAPDFTLTDTNNTTHSLSNFKGKYVVLEWVNPDCPFVVKHYAPGNMQALQAKYTAKDVVWLSINSSAPGKQGNYPPAELNAWAEKNNVKATAILLDSDGTVGRQYGAQTTPHMYIIDPTGNLVYQGAIDSIPSADSADITNAQNYVATALDEAMEGKPVTTASTKSYGCSVKY